jgi:hypothetical protein
MPSKAADVDGFIVDEETSGIPGELSNAHWLSIDVVVTVLSPRETSLWTKPEGSLAIALKVCPKAVDRRPLKPYTALTT